MTLKGQYHFGKSKKVEMRCENCLLMLFSLFILGYEYRCLVTD